jgi:hypothetical protein
MRATNPFVAELRNASNTGDAQGIGHVLLGAQRRVELLEQDRYQTGADQGEHHGRWNKQERIE